MKEEMTIGQALGIIGEALKYTTAEAPTYGEIRNAFARLLREIYKDKNFITVILEPKGVEVNKYNRKVVEQGTLLYINKDFDKNNPVAHIKCYDNDICIGELKNDADVTDGLVVVCVIMNEEANNVKRSDT